MQVITDLEFKRLRDPFPWEMDDGRKGVSFAFEALDQDGEKVRVKCSEDTYLELKAAGVKPGTKLIGVRLVVGNPRVDGGDGLTIPKG